jgi:hypothetical protein
MVADNHAKCGGGSQSKLTFKQTELASQPKNRERSLIWRTYLDFLTCLCSMYDIMRMHLDAAGGGVYTLRRGYQGSVQGVLI